MPSVAFYYDVVCPYSYMESGVVEKAEDRGDLEVDWRPYDLRMFDAIMDVVRARRALERGIEIHLPRYQPRSTLPLAACLWAEEQGRLRAFKHALYEAFFCEGEDIATDDEIARAAERAGLDGAEAVRAAYSPELGSRLQAIRQEAETAGIRGVPSVLAEDGRNHWGMGGVERLLSGEPLVPRPA